jgi:hypothetical protein
MIEVARAQTAVPDAVVGTTVALSGQWYFKPTGSDKQFPVPVPQMLSRIQWWLDDSEDFKKWEQRRLDAFGFDTEKTDEGTYRLTFLCAQFPKDRHLWVEFDGVAMRCKVFCNDHELGEHQGMFSRFSYDLTPYLKDGANTLTVWCSMEKIPATRAQLGEAVTVNLSGAKVISMSKGMFGPLTTNRDNRAYDLFGIWQPVRLVVRGGAKINDVFFQTAPDLDGAKIDVEVQSHGTRGPIKLRARFLDPKASTPGRVEFTQSAELAGLAHVMFQGGGFHPKLWTPAEPNLYRLEVTAEAPDGTVLDRWSENVGFRTFEVKGNQFLLNGKPYFLRGANQLPYGKNPWDPALARKLIQFMHDGNLRFTRTHATPWNNAWLDAADEIGLAVSIEGIRPWAFAGKAAEGKETLMPPKEIFEHWLMENEDVVKRCRNHPSVFIFTVGNEMLLRDTKNLEKWKLLSDVTKQTRKLAPDRPIVCSSDYTRDPEFYESTLKPAGIDDGDLDDMHRYTGWYANSTFVIDSKFDKEASANSRQRPLIGQEMATGYPDLDSGLPVLRYTRDLLTPQAWVGLAAYPGNDPALWLAEHAKLTQRWAEQMRYQRGKNTSGFSLFSLECWFSHSFDPETVKPYPVYQAVRQAFAPLGLAIETNRRRFYGGSELASVVYVTNDDEQFKDLTELSIQCKVMSAEGEELAASEATKVGKLAYYETRPVPLKLIWPSVSSRQRAALVTIATRRDQEVGQTSNDIELFPPVPEGDKPKVRMIKPGSPLTELAEGGKQRKAIEDGATLIVFAPAKEIVDLFPDDLIDVKPSIGEYADWAPVAGTALAKDLQPMDLKWWAHYSDARAFVAKQSHRLKPGGKARELIRYIPAHGYIAEDKVKEQYRCVMSEIPIGKGRLWICDLDLQDCSSVDPAAKLFEQNLLAAAGDPESTKKLPTIGSHEELLKGTPK